MTPAHFFGILRVETWKTLTRPSGVACLALSVVIPLLSLALLWELVHSEALMVNGVPVASQLSGNGLDAAGWALRARNFLFVPLLLVLATALGISGERADRTLREVLVRPVSRGVALAARLLAVTALAGSGLLLTAVVAVGVGFGLFGTEGVSLAALDEPSVVRLLLGFGATLLCDVGLICLTAAIASFFESVGGVVVTLIFTLLADLTLRLALQGLAFLGLEEARLIEPWTLGNALGAWEGWVDGFSAARLLALLLVITGGAALSAVRFFRMDAP